MTLQANRRIVREYIRANYSDEHLIKALDHARAGKMRYASCDCLIGIPTADHELTSDGDYGHPYSHYQRSLLMPGAREADRAYADFSMYYGLPDDENRRRLLIPILLCELRRRNRVRPVARERVEVSI